MMRSVRSLIVMAMVVLAALYGFAAATPALAHAGHAPSPAGYIVKHHQTAKAHAHHASTLVVQADATNYHSGQAGAAKCCGLSCLTAAPQQIPLLVIIELNRSPVPPSLEPELLGRGPDRLDRPPTV